MLPRSRRAAWTVALSCAFAAVSRPANSQLLDQYATSVIGFSSEYNSAPGSYSTFQALGPPNTFNYGDFGTA